jgi:hypothetical protein
VRLSDESIQKIKDNRETYDVAVSNAIKDHEVNLKNHFILRKEHLKSMANDFNERNESKKGHSVESLMRQEQSMQDFNKLR